MIIIADKRIPFPALKKLDEFGEVLALETRGLVYDAISGHPDIFFSQINDQLVISPNLPEKYKQVFSKSFVQYQEGALPIGAQYPETARYNCVATEQFIIHNFQHCDPKIKDLSVMLERIPVNQGYTRCNLLPLKNNSFITSDKGIYQSLQIHKQSVLYVEPDEILLPGFSHGFFGGTCGFYKDTLFIIGSLRYFKEAAKLIAFLDKLNIEIVELYDGLLFDGGSLIFVENQTRL